MVLHRAVDDWKAPADEFLPPGTNKVGCESWRLAGLLAERSGSWLVCRLGGWLA